MNFDGETVDLKDPLAVLNADGELHVWVECVVDEAVREGGLADGGLAHCDEFDFVALNGDERIHNRI